MRGRLYKYNVFFLNILMAELRIFYGYKHRMSDVHVDRLHWRRHDDTKWLLPFP